MERFEDPALLTGRGGFVDNVGVKLGTLHAAVLRSPYAHAEVGAIDVSVALTLPGVRAVLTGADVRRWGAPFVVGVKQPMDHWCLAVERARYVGEPVAVVVAENRYLAEDALDRITVDYQPLPPVVDPEAAAAAGAPLLHPAVGSNVVSDRAFTYGDPDAQFAAAPHRVSLTVRYPRNSCTPIEGFVVVAEHLPGEAGYDVLSNFQGPFALHPVMALALKVPGARLRLRMARDSGGSFGVKQAVFAYIVLMCLASRKAGAPVKWVEDRLEHLTAATSATNRVTNVEAAVADDGEILALKYDQLDDCGGYLRAPEPATFYRMHGAMTGAYKVRHLAVRNRVVLTNKTPTGLVRGFGGPQVYFALERLMQRVAVERALDPMDVYRRNLVPAGAFPYEAPAGALLDSGNYQAVVELALNDGRFSELKARRARAGAEGRLYGIGCAAIVEPSVSNMGYITTALTAADRARSGARNGAIASATVSVDPLGTVSVLIDSTPQGQGHATVAAQVVADVLGLTPADIAVNAELDTQKDAWSLASGNYSSRFAAASAGAVHLAAMKVRARISDIAASMLGTGAAEVAFAGGRIYAQSRPEKTLGFTRVAGTAHWAPAMLPEHMSPGLRETVFWSPEQLAAPDEHDVINTSATYGFAFDYCGVEIDRETGRVHIDRYITAHDAGRLLNPALADGQIRGGFAQGLGAALMEEFAYGPDGSFLSGTYADYLVPTASDVPDPEILHVETPSPFTPLGAKGIGEGANMTTPVCIANAVADALGVADVVLPLTPARVSALIGMTDPPPSRAASAPRPPVSAAGGYALAGAGSIDVAAPPEAVFGVLVDPLALAEVIPGCRELHPIAEHRYRADVTMRVGPIKARYDAEIALSDLDPPRALRVSGKGVGALGAAEGWSRVTLEPRGAGTHLRYEYEATVSGKAAAAGGRMLEQGATVVLRQLFERFGRRAAQGGPEARSSWWRRVLGAKDAP